MTEFSVGGRVRVRNVRAVGSFAGQVGTIVEISRTLAGKVYAYHVKLDGSQPDALVEVRMVFSPNELEREPAPEEDRP